LLQCPQGQTRFAYSKPFSALSLVAPVNRWIDLIAAKNACYAGKQVSWREGYLKLHQI